MPWNDNGSDNPWRRNARGGPPDLDDLFGGMLRRVFGGKGGGRSGDGSGGEGGGGFRGLPARGGLIALGLGALWLLSGFYIVEASERGVVTRFGEYDRTTMPGPGWRIPYPIESVEVVNVTGNRSVKKRTTMLTQDENIVELEFSVQYRLKSAEDYLFNVERPDIEGDRQCRFSSTICGVLDSAIRTTVGRNKMDYILREGRSEIASKTMVLMQEILDLYGTGIEVLTVNLEDSQPPNAVQDAFQDATKAREDMERFKNEAQAYANEVLPQARGEAARMLEDARAYRARVVANAEGEASRFTQLLAEYQKAPEVTRQRMYMQAVEDVLSSSSKVVVDVDKGSNMLFLPLDRILEQRGRAPAGGAAAPASPAAGDDDARGDSGLGRRLRQGR